MGVEGITTMKNRYDQTIHDQTFVRTGIVFKHGQTEWTTTTYSGGNGGYVDQYGNRISPTPVTSHTTHHHKQEIWYRDSDDNDYNLKLHNVEFEIAEGQGMAVLGSNRSGKALRVANLKTRYFWDLACGNKKRGKFAKIIGKVGIRLKALVIAALAAAPFINVIAILILLLSSIRKRHFRGIYNRPRSYSILYILSALAAFMPLADELFDSQLMNHVIDEDSSFTVSGSTVRSAATLGWRLLKPFEKIIGEPLSTRDELDAELAQVPETVTIVYKAAGTKQKAMAGSDTVIYDREIRDAFWFISFTILAFLFMYLRSVSADRIALGVAEALDTRIRDVINEDRLIVARAD